MSDEGDADREQQILDNHDRYLRFPDPDCNVCFLLTLLDKERNARPPEIIRTGLSPDAMCTCGSRDFFIHLDTDEEGIAAAECEACHHIYNLTIP